MLSGNRKREIQIPPEKKSKYPKLVGSLSAEVLFHVGARARNATVSQIPRQLNATTAPLGYWNALSKYKYKHKLICSRHNQTNSYNERIQMMTYMILLLKMIMMKRRGRGGAIIS